ncbi:DUF7379 domain-containing protein [Pseudomonas alkylphenolica]|uniref:Lecithin:cholesterol acyltransferase n=1 Tax=Pseudomonas alkylphenolica TaxID=237609 RepID=A0A077F6S4_9PSED|nr:CHAT domain-containing protein [Pseudomonas alkylphenolica]AIL61232.1 Lecithin:cholesterol acyltransferase [Pseudomonas alkylphenolica]
MKPTDAPPLIKLPLEHSADVAAMPLQTFAASTSRSAGGGPVSTLDNVRVLKTWELTAAARSSDAPHSETLHDPHALLALEANDGSTIFIRADALVEQLRRTRPDVLDRDGAVDFARFTDIQGKSRGVPDWIWRKVRQLVVEDDDITEAAKALITDKVTGVAVNWAAQKGATALMKAIENQLAGPSGLYRWNGGALSPQDMISSNTILDADKPMLLFIHGTGSHTLGSFGELPSTAAWKDLQLKFGKQIAAFEHRTFSQSPIDNALEIVTQLPRDTVLQLVSHSRGGLVADLLCIDPDGPHLSTWIENYRRDPRPDEVEREKHDPALVKQREDFAKEEQRKLVKLVGLLKSENIKVTHYVRVAAPARGTALLSDNLDVFLSCLLNLVRKFATWGIGAAVSAVATPVAGSATANVADRSLKLLERVVLEIADKRLQPQVVPGIEAMLPEAPMGMLLARAAPLPNLKMAVIAGDSEESASGILQRIGYMFVDWALFDRARNDLVVNTESMYGGVYGHAKETHAMAVEGPQVNHFNYFRDAVRYRNRPLPSSLSDWLLDRVIVSRDSKAETSRDVGEALLVKRQQEVDAVVFIVPGIMGSSLGIDSNTLWLDPLELALKGLGSIAIEVPNVTSKGLIELAYGKLHTYLEATHYKVIDYHYDWRKPLQQLGSELAQALQEQIDSQPKKNIRILAHSMGGLVVRAAFAEKELLWPELVKSADGLVVMLGTPNHGAYSMVETLLGQSDTVRMLARVDMRNPLREILQIVGKFPGALHLLPAPGFEDVGGRSPVDFFGAASWSQLAMQNNDFWFGDELGARPDAAALEQVKQFWQKLEANKWLDVKPERVSYVYGQGKNTPCGLDISGEQLMLRGTAQGDGTVTWRSGHLAKLPEDRYWYMPVVHGELASTERYFSEIECLLFNRTPKRLERLPSSRTAERATALVSFRGGPPAYPADAQLLSQVLGCSNSLEPKPELITLQINVLAMNLSCIQVPLICGHYRGDPISGAEAAIDQTLVNGALSQRQRLGLYSGELGNATVVLVPRTAEEVSRETGRGAVMIGLGDMGELTAEVVTQAVRSGVLRYLLNAVDQYAQVKRLDDPDKPDSPLALHIASLLLGTNSSAQLTVDESIRAITLGVLQANREYDAVCAGPKGRAAAVTRLDIVEMFVDAAICAGYAVATLDQELAGELQRLNSRLELAQAVQFGEGARPRLSVTPPGDYWPRLQVSNADGVQRYSAPETRLDDAASKPAQRFNYLYMGQRARVEALVDQRQPGLLEKMVDSALRGHSTRYDPTAFFGNSLFQLMLPLSFKSAVRKSDNLILVLDDSSANLPWEMLESDGVPLIKRSRLVRQFITQQYRREVVRTDIMNACVVGNPDTRGYFKQFGEKGQEPLSDCLAVLPGATRESQAVSRVLEGAGYATWSLFEGASAVEVFDQLFARPYRVLVICAHGVFQSKDSNGQLRSGVVLSDGLLLTAAEIDRMETVPDLVFLSCCHLGKVTGFEPGGNRLAASLAQELINMGVRCVVAAGWEVDDNAACCFSESFFNRLAIHGDPFAEAITCARRETLEQFPACNTWGAYQAYGDPLFQLRLLPSGDGSNADLRGSPELLDWLEGQRLIAANPNPAATGMGFKQLRELVDKRLKGLPESWINQAEVQYGLGLLYSEWREADALECAREALLKAVARFNGRGCVPMTAVEKLIDVEIRQAYLAAAPGFGAGSANFTRAKEWIEMAIARADGLRNLCVDQPDGLLARRQVMRGRALKYQVHIALLERSDTRTSATRATELDELIAKSFEDARLAYAEGEDATAPDWNPYAMLNRIQFEVMSRPGPLSFADLERCLAEAQARYKRYFGVFDALMKADVQLTRWLIIVTGRVLGQVACPERELIDSYDDALAGQRISARQFDSVVRQLQLISSWMQWSQSTGDATVPGKIAEILQRRG